MQVRFCVTVSLLAMQERKTSKISIIISIISKMREGKWISAAILRRIQPPFCVETSRHCVLHVIIELKQAAFLSQGRQPEEIVAFQLTSDVSELR